MPPLAVDTVAFGVVVVGVAVLGVVVGFVLAFRNGGVFAGERGGLWMFHGNADTSPHQMAGARFEERHVIDPEPPGPAARPERDS